MAIATTVEARPTALAGLGRITAWRQALLLGALAGSIALGVGVALWSQTPNYALLYGSLAGKDAADVLEALERNTIPFRVEEGSGAILVPAGKVHEARLKLARDELPRGTSRGFEVLERNQSFGTSQFMERARYQHALEIEIARTITSMNPVQSARVHLAMPRQSAFVRQRKPPSASVLVNLHPGRQLDGGQPEAIAHLIAAAIPGLEATQVRVVDERGYLLTQPQHGENGAPNRAELDYARRMESEYVKRIESILTPIVGFDAVRAQVVAEVDFSSTEQARELFNPDLPALRSEHVIEEQRGQSTQGGVPGALTNQPPAQASVPEQQTGEPGATPASAARRSGNRQLTRNYELDRTVSHIRKPAGRIQRLSVAVVVDDVRAVDSGGASTSRSRTPEEIEHITGLVKETMGFNAARGDSVNVVNTPFAVPPEVAPLPEAPIWKQPWVLDAARQVGGALFVLFLAFGVFRPVMKTLVARDITEREVEQANARVRLNAPSDEEMAQDTLSLSGRASGSLADHGADIDAIKSLVATDPKRVANVVRNWVTDDA